MPEVTYGQYLRWIANYPQPIQPYTQKEWDTMPTINKYGITLTVREWLNGADA